MWLCLLLPTASAQYQLELSFDDENNGSTLNNMETTTGITATLVAPAARTTYGQGRFGRGVDFADGSGVVEVAGWSMDDVLVAHLWVQSRGDGRVLELAPDWWVGIDEQRLILVSPESTVDLGVDWPADEVYRHLTLRAEGLTSTSVTVEAEVDFGEPTTGSASPPLAPRIRLGGFNGRLDEVIIANRRSATRTEEQDTFNRDPTACVSGAHCEEHVLDVQPGLLGFDVPLRLKAVYDPQQCQANAPCPLLIAVQGGNSCANDYASPAELVPMVEAGFFVVTPDPYCEGAGRTRLYREELDQMLATKDYAFETWSELLTPNMYGATGCSHGADMVQIWALHDPDHPDRTFVRSAAGSGLCARIAGEICGATVPPNVDVSDLQEMHEVSDFVGMIDEQNTADREIARTWGRAFDDMPCGPDGSVLCWEEGQLGVTYASRRFRDVWEARQPADAPTGWFAADISGDCRHCAEPGSEAFECGLCLLKEGRSGMAVACPDCLTNTSDIDGGWDAEACPLDAPWYTDPLDTLDTLDETDTGGSNHSDTTAASEPTESTRGGCGCHTTGTVLPVLAWVPWMWWMVRRRRARTHTPPIVAQG